MSSITRVAANYLGPLVLTDLEQKLCDTNRADGGRLFGTQELAGGMQLCT